MMKQGASSSLRMIAAGCFRQWRLVDARADAESALLDGLHALLLGDGTTLEPACSESGRRLICDGARRRPHYDYLIKIE
ncbi:hypothetical protein [Burkholderia ubonensis]|uniref:hypothetical protein n=1 Tax=Burkholderia ubonensis TaxID=101571 RepID=UPI001056AB34|nr:hypothetical protein [Burkholderia ubonensis]